MTTKAERQAHREAGLSASDFPMPPIPLMHPNAEWCESYARWHSQFVAASRRPAVEAAPSGAEEMARALYDALSAEDGTSFIGEFSASGPVTIDGRFDLSKVAGRLSAARAVSAPAAAPGGWRTPKTSSKSPAISKGSPPRSITTRLWTPMN
ncbi:hypothetical protein [Azospirillum baldaniorum]|uniref:hypothetical protein n=1 Tax=Azospirillum baldaniorum TaxID=1064539 RepID=UPI001013D5E9|nr:hypothetical protein [Azospirillum baldaniorum]